MVDESTRKTLSSIPLLQTKAGPRDKELWVNRLKEEYQALIKVRITSVWRIVRNLLVYYVFIVLIQVTGYYYVSHKFVTILFVDVLLLMV